MIAPASLIGFGLVFLSVSWGTSLALNAAFLLGRARVRRWGPLAERRSAQLAVAGPPLLGLVVTAALVAESWFAIVQGYDHCADHAHHLHLCLRHGTNWAAQAWVLATLAGFGAFTAVHAAQKVAGLWKARASLRTLARLAVHASGLPSNTFVVPANSPFCFTAGLLRPRVFISTAALEQLSPPEQRAALEHEACHVEQADVLRRTVLGFLALLGVPSLPARSLAAWDVATERLCDLCAAGALGCPTTVASALLILARTNLTALPGATCFAEKSTVEERIESLLAGEAAGHRAGRWIARVALVLAGGLVAVLALHSDPIHHLAETLLALI